MQAVQPIVVDPISPGGVNSPHGLILFHLIPLAIRDEVYDLVARNRYRWFGRREACVLPNSDRSWPL